MELIITEKPSSAKKIADALSDGKAVKHSESKVPYYSFSRKGADIMVVSAVGHLYTVSEKEKTPWSMYPIYDIEWVPTYEVDKSADYSKKYLQIIKKLCKNVDEITVATDYDIEGEVIGYNIVRNICKAKDANRMKFSTLTKDELIDSYENKFSHLNWGQALAGETRHILDFFYGINLTRALTDSINKTKGGFKVLSSGRVQGPALKIIVDKEKDIQAFVPVPFWQIELHGLLKSFQVKAMHHEDKFWEEAKAKEVMSRVEGQEEGKIRDTKKNRFQQKPPVPFDLTSLQTESYRCFRIKPKHTLEIAQRLYTEGYISYPRTSSQKLPQVLGFKKILGGLKRQQIYAGLVDKVLSTSLRPNEGKKTDDAHPAIYPTGIAPEGLEGRDFKVYDLIVKRFFSVFMGPATRETNILHIDVNNEIFVAKGTVTIDKGWHETYEPYVKLDELELPQVEKGDTVDVKEINLLDKETKPPKRYTQSSIIQELEKKNLGTKATRAQVIETLYERGYVLGDDNIEATELGIKTIETLGKYCSEITDEELTRQFEEEMEQIRQKQTKESKILDDAKKVLNKIIQKFRDNQQSIGQELAEANYEAVKAATTVGKCPNCREGELVLRKGKFGQFIACNQYPDCKTTFAVPRASIKPTDKQCPQCSLPMVKVKAPRKSAQDMCINPDCPSKKDENDKPSYPEEGMTCPSCQEGKMVLRKGFYGSFLGCDRYPKCKTMMKIVDGKVDTTPITTAKKTSKSASKKAGNKTSKGTVAKKTTKKTTKKAAKKTPHKHKTS